MGCVGKLSWQCQSPWELGRPKEILHRGHRLFWRRNPERPVYSSAKCFAASHPNGFQYLDLRLRSQKLAYGPAMKFRSSEIIDLLPQEPESMMAVEGKVYSLYGCNVGSGNQLHPSRPDAVNSNPGQNLWNSRRLPSVGRGDTTVRAQRISRQPSEESSDYTERTDSEDYGRSVWDSNAESVPRRRFRRTSYTTPEVEEAPYWQRDNGFRKNEWDFDSEARAGRKASQGWQWWANDDDDNEGEEQDSDEEEEEDEDPSWLSWWTGDVKDAFLLLRWGLPAAFLLGTALIPTMIGNPLLLLIGFSIFPTVARFFNPLAKGLFGSVFNPSGSSSSTRRRRPSRPMSASNRRSQDTDRYGAGDNFGSSSRPSSRMTRDSVELSRAGVRPATGSLGGWEDLVEDRSRGTAESKWPLQKRPKSGKRLVKREQPLYVRLILAFFPFLRGWGGIL